MKKKIEIIYNLIEEEVKNSGVSNLDWDINLTIERSHMSVNLRLNKGSITNDEIWDAERRIRAKVEEVFEPREKTIGYNDKIVFHRPMGIGPDSGFPDRMEVVVHKTEKFTKNYDGEFQEW